MPSSYRFYATSMDGKKPVDLVSNDRDVIASVANYFHQHGWKDKQPIAEPATASDQAGVMEFLTQQGPEYWQTYPNFRVITHYNTSPQYALAAYLLSQQLRRQWASLQQTGRAHA